MQLSNTYYDWLIQHGYIMLAGTTLVSEFLETFKEFPPRQQAANFTIDQAMERMERAASGAQPLSAPVAGLSKPLVWATS